jgi:glucokinase
LKNKPVEEITCHDVFNAYQNHDEIANEVINICIQFWGMATANLVSLFNPEKIIFGGGVFGPAIPLIAKIKEEATKWAQPISIKQVSFETSGLGSDAGVFGAGFLALNNLS